MIPLSGAGGSAGLVAMDTAHAPPPPQPPPTPTPHRAAHPPAPPRPPLPHGHGALPVSQHYAAR